MMADTPPKQDESMENILHSIRNIITEGGQPDAEESAANANVNAPADDILELTQVVRPGSVPAPANDVLADIDKALAAPPFPPSPNPENPKQPAAEIPMETPQQPQTEAAAAPALSEETPPPAEPRNNGLVGKASAEASTAALKTLLQNIPKPEIHSAPFRTGNTVEDLVVETLRPMLAAWLDKNLPVIVQELVEKEIRKLVPRE